MVNTSPILSVRCSRSAAFTLIEAVLALAISAVVLAAIGGVFYSALRLRDRSVAMLNEGSRLQPVLAIIKRDLLGAMQPEGVLASIFRCGNLDGLLTQGVGVQFITTTGSLDVDSGYGDLQEVTYMLRESSQGRRGNLKELVRMVERNLLGTAIEPPREEFLLGDVETFQVDCFDGSQWRSSWDTSFTDTNLPVAVRVQIQVAPEGSGENPRLDAIASSPIELVIPLMIQSRTNTPATATEEGDEQ